MVEGKNEVKKIRAKAGESFRIRLWEDRTKGSRWVADYDTTSLRLVGDEYERTRNIRVSDIGMHYFEFVAMQPGTYLIEFELRYGWKFSAEDRLSYDVEISE
jgi:predicted secreted protein